MQGVQLEFFGSLEGCSWGSQGGTIGVFGSLKARGAVGYLVFRSLKHVQSARLTPTGNLEQSGGVRLFPTLIFDFWFEITEDALVDMRQNRPCLFDCSSQCYSNRNAKAKALNEIASALGTGGV